MFGLALIIVFLSLYLSPVTRNPKNTSPITIGFIGPLTGDASNKGQNAKAAVQIAVEEINDTGGIDGRTLEVVYKDGGCDRTRAHKAARELIHTYDVPVILGGLCSHETLSFTKLAEESKTVVLSYCSTAPEISQAGDYIFRNNPSSLRHAYFAAKYMKKIMNADRVAILYVNEPWGIGIMSAFLQKFTEDGGTITAKEVHEQSDTDLRTQIAKIKATNPDAVYFLGYPKASIAGLKQIRELDLAVPIFGNSTWDNPTVWEETGSAGEGIHYSIAFSPLNDAFENIMLDRFGIAEILDCTPQAYDGMKILAQVIDKVGDDPEAIKNALYKTVYKSGISSNKIEFDQNGDVHDATYLVKRIEGGTAIKTEYYRTDQIGEEIVTQ